MRSGTPKVAHNNVMCIYGSNSELQSYFNVVDKDAAYLFVLDREGRIRWKYVGAITDDAYHQLKNMVSDLLKPDYTKN